MPPRTDPAKPPGLVLRGQSYFARVRVPPSLVGVLTRGKTEHITRTLGTRNRAEAHRRLPHVVADIKAGIERARRNPDGTLRTQAAPVEEIDAVVAWWREWFAAEGTSPSEALSDEGFRHHMDQIAGEQIGEEWDDRREPVAVYDEERLGRANRIIGLVTGDVVPSNMNSTGSLRQRGTAPATPPASGAQSSF